MFDANKITAEIVMQMLDHFQWRTGALLWFAVPDVVSAANQPHPLEQSPVRDYVETLCRIVNEQPARDEVLVAEVYDITQSLAEGLCSHAWGHGYEIPRSFWGTEIGQLIVRAQLWARGDELITLTDAALILRGAAENRDLVYVNKIIEAGKLTAYIDLNEPNRTKARRVSRADVEALTRRVKGQK